MIPLRDRLPTRTTPVVNYALLTTNALAFWLQLTVWDESVMVDWGFVPDRFWHDPVAQSLTVGSAMFLHSGWLHIGGNLLFLWVFGKNVEDAIGHGRYVLFYVGGGVAAAVGHLLVDPTSNLPMVGASGAIAAVLAGYVSLFPRVRVLVLFPVFIIFLFFEFPAWLVVLEWFALNLLRGVYAIASDDHGGVAWFAHIGGFLAGLFLIRAAMIGRPAIAYDKWTGWRSKAASKRRPRVVYRRPRP
ncbi:MAG: rhomboid family intramembrane serine protease [Sorangium cellulosum]|nr:MAG: rhomboid family intramembrane serine protease [Sorangium cellulosum]